MNLNELAAAYFAAKTNEESAVAERRRIAALIQEATGHQSEGAKTYSVGDYKVTVKAPLIRSMDWKAWANVKDQINPDLHPIKVKEELDEKGVAWIQANEPEIYAILATCITTKPGALSVSVKPVEK